MKEGCPRYIYLIVFNLESGKRRAGGKILSPNVIGRWGSLLGSFLQYYPTIIFVSISPRTRERQRERERKKNNIYDHVSGKWCPLLECPLFEILPQKQDRLPYCLLLQCAGWESICALGQGNFPVWSPTFAVALRYCGATVNQRTQPARTRFPEWSKLVTLTKFGDRRGVRTSVLTKKALGRDYVWSSLWRVIGKGLLL